MHKKLMQEKIKEIKNGRRPGSFKKAVRSRYGS